MREMRDSGFGYIGQIPQAWSIGKLKQFFEKSNVTNHPDDTVLSLYRDYGVIPKDSRDDNHNVTSLDTSKYKHVDVGDFVINKMKGWQGSMALSPYEGIVSPAYHVFKFRSSELYPKYAHYLLRCRSFADEWRRLSTGLRVGQWDLHVEDFLNTCIPHPPLDEQRRIADSLDERCADIDVAVDAASSNLTDYQQLRTAIISSAVTRGVDDGNRMVSTSSRWIKSIPDGWSIRQLKSLSTYISDGVHQTPEYVLEGVPFISIKDVSSGKIRFDDCKYISWDAHEALSKSTPVGDGDVLFTRIGTLGKSVVVRKCPPFDIFVSLGIVKPKKEIIVPEYLSYVMQSSYYMEYIQHVKVDGKNSAAKYNLGDVRKSPIILPPMDEQMQIVKYLDYRLRALEQLLSTKQSIIADLKAYKQSLVYEVVTGKREVR